MQKREKGQEQEHVSRDVLARMEVLAVLMATVGLMVLALLRPAPLGEMADPLVTPTHVSAPWIFAWIQELLRHLPAFVGGVLVPSGLFLLIVSIPFIRIQVTPEGSASIRGRLLPLIILFLCLLVVAVMTVIHYAR